MYSVIVSIGQKLKQKLGLNPFISHTAIEPAIFPLPQSYLLQYPFRPLVHMSTWNTVKSFGKFSTPVFIALCINH